MPSRVGIGEDLDTASSNPLSTNPLSSSSATARDLVSRTELFVRRLFDGQDPSHDFYHIARVRKTAVKLAESLVKRGNYTNLFITELAALLHDVGDAKYAMQHAEKLQRIMPNADLSRPVPGQFLESIGCPVEVATEVQSIVERVGYRKEIGTSSFADTKKSNELDCVRDADKLDAIGAIGIARCFAFGGARNTALHNPDSKPLGDSMSKEEYAARSKEGGTCINHFYEKLLKLSSMMKTEEGKKLAKERHDYLKGFLDQFDKEWKGLA